MSTAHVILRKHTRHFISYIYKSFCEESSAFCKRRPSPFPKSVFSRLNMFLCLPCMCQQLGKPCKLQKSHPSPFSAMHNFHHYLQPSCRNKTSKPLPRRFQHPFPHFSMSCPKHHVCWWFSFSQGWKEISEMRRIHLHGFSATMALPSGYRPKRSWKQDMITKVYSTHIELSRITAKADS